MYQLHRLGWNSFPQLCLTVAREVLGQTVQSFLDSNDAIEHADFQSKLSSRLRFLAHDADVGRQCRLEILWLEFTRGLAVDHSDARHRSAAGCNNPRFPDTLGP